jgi:preprotein translocase subunit SecE
MAEQTKERRTSPAQFVQEVRSEASRVVWPGRKETGITTLMVFLMAALIMVFLFLVDQVLRIGIETIIRFGGS